MSLRRVFHRSLSSFFHYAKIQNFEAVCKVFPQIHLLKFVNLTNSTRQVSVR